MCDVTCKTCGETKPQDQYQFRLKEGARSGYYEKTCKECRNSKKRKDRQTDAEIRPGEVSAEYFNPWRGPVDPLPWRVSL